MRLAVVLGARPQIIKPAPIVREALKDSEKARELFASEGLKSRLKRLPNPFGDGKASGKIIDALKGCVVADDL